MVSICSMSPMTSKFTSGFVSECLRGDQPANARAEPRASATGYHAEWARRLQRAVIRSFDGALAKQNRGKSPGVPNHPQSGALGDRVPAAGVTAPSTMGETSPTTDLHRASNECGANRSPTRVPAARRWSNRARCRAAAADVTHTTPRCAAARCARCSLPRPRSERPSVVRLVTPVRAVGESEPPR